MSSSNENFQTLRSSDGKKIRKRNLVATPSRLSPLKSLNHVVPLKQLRGNHTEKIVLFCLEVAALETVRRLSKAKCPFVWKYVQAVQFLGYPPFKWIKRWGPFQILVNLVQKFSRPLLVLSIATVFSDPSENRKRTDNGVNEPPRDSELPNEPSTSDIRNCEGSDVTTKDFVSENWLLKILGELEKEGISLPKRIDEDELRRFHTSTKGDLSCLLSALKKTIIWRETYCFLSSQELEAWSNLVFWHGLDVMHRPCLVIRLGLACSSLSSHDRPHFAQSVVSQMEHGVLHLVNEADPRITVLIDCKRLTPFRFPMQMLKSCCTLVQDHYPNRLAILYLVRLPPVSRVIAQTFMKVLRPETRQKLRIEGETYSNTLSEALQSLPQFLGGKCTCSNCETPVGRIRTQDHSNEEEPSDDPLHNIEPPHDEYPAIQNLMDHRFPIATIVGIVILWIVIAFISSMHHPNPLSFMRYG